MKIIEIPFNWIYTQGVNSTVAVLDTHCDISHKHLAKNVKKYSVNAKQRDYGQEHATHVSGTIVNVAPLCNLNIYQVLFVSDIGTAECIADSIDCAIGDNVDVINLSLALMEDFSCVRESIKRAYDNNIIVVGAVSNDGLTEYPAKYKEVLSVTAFEDNHKADIYTEETIMAALPGNIYGELTGHSMATAYVSGICALAKSYDKRFNKELLLSCLKRKTPDI